jgi:3-dehydroquinate dehydratase-2
MSEIRLLVIRGPHLELLGKRKPFEKEPTSEVVDQALQQAFGNVATLKTIKGPSEAALVEQLQRQLPGVTHALVSLGALAPTAYVLREILELNGISYAEVFVASMPRTEQLRKLSVFREGAVAQVMGPAGAVFLQAAEKLLGKASQPLKLVPSGVPIRTPPKAAPAAPVKKTLGRAAPQGASANAPPAKTLGRRSEPRAAPPISSSARGVTRAIVRQQIANRLSGKISASELATWGREQWLAVERGGATEAGQRETLAEALQALALSVAPGGQLSDPELLDLMARMG